MLRRAFIGQGLIALSPVLTPLALAARPPSSGETVSAATFEGLLEQDFLAYPGVRGVRLRLLRVLAFAAPVKQGIRQFSLVFRADHPTALASGSYPVDVPGYGRLIMHLQQVTDITGKIATAEYRADFSLL